MSAKNCDKKGRLRSVTVGFRMSPEEATQLDIAVALSGLTKQNYIIRRLENRDIIVQGNPRVYKALRNQLIAVLDELKRNSVSSAVSGELLDTIKLIAVTMDGPKDEDKNHKT